MSALASKVLMIEPSRFYSNPETWADNTFQKHESARNSQDLALKEFFGLKVALEDAGVTVQVFKDPPDSVSPDSIFPNNWLSTHAQGLMVTYPMRAMNRRLERRPQVIEALRRNYSNHIDLSPYELQGHFLEGTGSLLLERASKTAFACLSERTHQNLIDIWAKQLNYKVITFQARDHGMSVYHTNCMMGLTLKRALICLEAVSSESQRQALISALEGLGREVLDLSIAQMESYCANVLELQNAQGGEVLVMSDRAYFSLTPNQRQTLEQDSALVHCPLNTIEDCGGGSARCMLAELF